MGREERERREWGGGEKKKKKERKKERKKPSVVPLQAHALIFTFRATLGIFLMIENHHSLGKPRGLTSRAFLSLSLLAHTNSLRPERNLFQFVRRVKHWPRLTRDAGLQRRRGVPVPAKSSELQHGPRLRFSSILDEKGMDWQALSG